MCNNAPHNGGPNIRKVILLFGLQGLTVMKSESCVNELACLTHELFMVSMLTVCHISHKMYVYLLGILKSGSNRSSVDCYWV